MADFKYNHLILKETREKKNITALNIAVDLCLAERQIHSLEQNSPQHFPSQSLRKSVLKKYILALGLKVEDVIEYDCEEDPIPVLLKKS